MKREWSISGNTATNLWFAARRRLTSCAESIGLYRLLTLSTRRM